MKQYLRHWLCWMLPLPALLAGWPALAHDFFVATNGGDANPGTQAKPFATLDRARSAVRDLKAHGGLAGLTKVVVRGGTYFLRETFVLTPNDSGTAAAPVVYCAADGQQIG